MAPTSWNGSISIYYKIIRPFFLKHERTIDSGIEQATEAGQTIFKEGNIPKQEVTMNAMFIKCFLLEF